MWSKIQNDSPCDTDSNLCRTQETSKYPFLRECLRVPLIMAFACLWLKKKKKKLVLLMCSHNLSAAACKLIAGCFWGTARRPAWCRCGASDLYPGEGESLQSDPEWGGWGCTAASGWPKCQGQGLRERQLRGSHHPQQYHSMWVYVFNNTVTLSTCKGNPLIRSPSCSLRWGATLKRFSGLCWWFLRQRL